MAAEVGEDREAEVAEGDEDADRPAHAGHIPGLFTWHTLRLEREWGRFSACLPASVKMHLSTPECIVRPNMHFKVENAHCTVMRLLFFLQNI